MNRLALLPALLLLIAALPALAANTPPSGPNGAIQYNNNGQYGPYIIGGGLSITTSGGYNFLNSTSTGSAAPAGTNGSIQYNANGVFGGYGLGSGLSVVGGNLVAQGSPGGSNGFIQYNNGGVLGGYSIGSGLAVVGGALVSTSSSGGTSPGGASPQLQYNTGTTFGGLTADTLAAYSAHDTVMNGLAYDPRNSAYGAICGGINHFEGNGSTKTFTYTIPFTGSSSTDNTGFFVFYEADGGFGAAVILNTTQFTVTGVNSGVGGTITTASAVPSSSSLYVIHDDGPGFIAASTASAASGGYISVPDGCTIYTNETNGTQLAEGVQLIGQNFTPTYAYHGNQGNKPVLTVIAPEGAAPNFGFNVGGKSRQFFEGFTITDVLPVNNNGYERVPVLIGSNSSSGAGGGNGVPGITLQYMDVNYAEVGFGAPHGGSSGYIFSALRFNNFTANDSGVYGPLSDPSIVGNDFVSNGSYGTPGTSGGLVLGPQQGGAGGSGAAKITANRFEFNQTGAVINDGYLISFDGNEFDSNSYCGMDLRTWGAIDITGGWFRASGTNGSGGTGNTTAGEDAHICINGAGNGLRIANTLFYNGYGRGYTEPIGTPNANTPLYFLDVNTAASGVSDISISNAEIQNSFTNGAYVTDFAIYRQGRPSGLEIDVPGQAVQGKIANGQFPAQARGLPDNSSTRFYAIGDVSLYSYDGSGPYPSWPTIVAKNMGTGPTLIGTGADQYSTFDCDIVDQEIMTTFNPRVSDNGIVAWLTGFLLDPNYGDGYYQGHLADTNACRLGGLVQMATPNKYRTYAQAATVTTTGSWGDSSFYGGAIGLTSTTSGSALTFTVTGQNAAYVGYELQATATGVASGGAFTVTVDGALQATVSTGGNSAWTYACGGLCPTSKTAAAVRVPLSSYGQHTIVANVISATTTANPVTINGVYLPPPVAYHGSTPTVYYSGQAGYPIYADSYAAFNTAEMQQANQLFADGYSVVFTDVQKYLNNATDYASNGDIQESGMGHVADAFGGTIQYHKDNSRSINPLDYGASCNAVYFAPDGFYVSQPQSCVQTTSGSPVISIPGYSFQPGVATQNGGGDVGKLAILGRLGDQGPTATILSVSTTSGGSSATLNENLALTSSSGNCESLLMFGYPTNPNDLSTASDDTAAIQAAAYASVNLNASLQTNAGGEVKIPSNCVIHDLRLPSGATLVGNNGATQYYGAFSGGATILWAGFTGYPDDIDTATGLARNIGVDTAYAYDIGLRNLTIVNPAFPYSAIGHAGMGAGVCVGAVTNPLGTDFSAQAFLADQVTFFLCPVALNVPMEVNQTVTFTANISGTTMNVLSITSSTIANDYFGGPASEIPDFLAVGNVVTGSGVTSGTKITGGAIGGQPGVYSVSLSQTVTTENMHTVPPTIQNTYYIKDSQFIDEGIAVNGTMSDSTFENDVFTSGYDMEWYNGPSSGDSGANRIIGGRMEECGGYCIIMAGNGNSMQITGMQFQSPTQGAILISGGSTADLSITGGWFNQYYGNPTSFITLSGSGTNLTVTGMDFGIRNTDSIMSVTTGSTFDDVSFNEGQVVYYSNQPPIFYNNLGGAEPVHVRNTIAGYAPTDTYIIPTLSGLAMTSTSGGIYSGGGLSSVTTSTTLSLSGLAPAPHAWNCQGGDATAGVAWAMNATTSTSCGLAATTTSGDAIWWSGVAH